VVIGDNIRWATALGKSQAGQIEQLIVYVKPTRPDLSTTMTINTDRRSYFLELTSWPNDYMVAVAWRYPQDEVAQIEAAAAQQDATDRPDPIDRASLTDEASIATWSAVPAV
jgi:type IV secretory pathway VirB9-like protein